MLTVFWDMKGPIIIDFLDKGIIVNCASNCPLLKKNSPYLLNDPHIYIVTHACLLGWWKLLRNKNNKKISVPGFSKKNKRKEKQGKGTPTQDASENKRRQPINTVRKTQKITQVKSFKYNKVYLHKYRKENLEQKNRT